MIISNFNTGGIIMAKNELFGVCGGGDPDQQNGNEIKENGKDKGPEIILGSVEYISCHPSTKSRAQPNASFYHSVDQSEVFSFVEVPGDGHEHGSGDAPSGSKEESK
jgi:hypothetical protein